MITASLVLYHEYLKEYGKFPKEYQEDRKHSTFIHFGEKLRGLKGKSTAVKYRNTAHQPAITPHTSLRFTSKGLFETLLSITYIHLKSIIEKHKIT